MMTDAQVVKRTITTNDNNASQDFSYQALLQKFKFSTKIDETHFFGNQWCTIFLLFIFSKLTQSYSRDAAYTHC